MTMRKVKEINYDDGSAYSHTTMETVIRLEDICKIKTIDPQQTRNVFDPQVRLYFYSGQFMDVLGKLDDFIEPEIK